MASRYVEPGKIPDLSEALHRLLIADVAPCLDPRVLSGADHTAHRSQCTECTAHH